MPKATAMSNRSRSDAIQALAIVIGTALALLTVIYANAFQIGPTSVALTGLGVVTSVFASVLAGLAVFFFWRTRRVQGEGVAGSQSIENRLERATSALHEAADVMAEVERELRGSQAKLESIRAEREQARALASIDRKAAEALRTQLTTIVKSEGHRWFWIGLAASFVVGVATTWVASLLQH